MHHLNWYLQTLLYSTYYFPSISSDRAMKFSVQTRHIFILLAILVAVVLVSTYFGCKATAPKKEGFDNEPADEMAEGEAYSNEPSLFDTTILDPNEKELFEKLKSDSISSDQVDKLISSGALTNEVMERFLTILGEGPVE